MKFCSSLARAFAPKASLAALAIALVLAGSGVELIAQAPAAAKSRPATPRDEPIDFEKLVRSLRNHNTPPRISGGWHMEFDKAYDFSEQRRVFKAIEALQIYAEEARPHLLAQIDNEQYSFTFGYGGASENYTVGDVCEEILRNSLSAAYRGVGSILQGTKVRMATVEDPQIKERARLKDWLTARRDKTLVELQLETLGVLSKRIEKFDVSSDKKTSLRGIIADGNRELVRDNVPRKLPARFVPNECWYYFTPEQAKQ